MKLKILYFGMISEITDCNEELIAVPDQCKVAQLEIFLKDTYINLQGLSFNIVVDKQISTSDMLLTSANEIALLPPFSGG
ncbi:MoaD/ThiS family protein [Aquimarina sp. RZ0]|uniref:MoaD/ThiS family protein n=1 Tax=Aquimarina sp. RZ0 TaxID=2607730 RepID=UPI0011F3DC86|nr:MoaD/ThiS family protein [Aquimarina sp. RZ0]KAA1248171.1 MoaD/ThiS family protein [Aquimarina sp. RZ0]